MMGALLSDPARHIPAVVLFCGIEIVAFALLLAVLALTTWDPQDASGRTALLGAAFGGLVAGGVVLAISGRWLRDRRWKTPGRLGVLVCLVLAAWIGLGVGRITGPHPWFGIFHAFCALAMLLVAGGRMPVPPRA